METDKKHHRIRLANYDYSQIGAYFITICTSNRDRILGEIVVGQGLCSCHLTKIGELVQSEIVNIESRFNHIHIDNYVIMPNHIHLIMSIPHTGQEQSPCPTIGDAVCALKSISTKTANRLDMTPGRIIWQYRYHDHIIRNDDEYTLIWQYIDSNPTKWSDDCYFS